MTQLTQRALVELLARARAALETPDDLDADDIGALIDDIGNAEDELALREQKHADGTPQVTSLCTACADSERSHLPDEDLLCAGRHCILSTTHLSAATAELLDRWSTALAHERPFHVAGNTDGWFVSTSNTGAVASTALPADIRAALTFGRQRGFDYLLFDCNAERIPDLPVHDW